MSADEMGAIQGSFDDDPNGAFAEHQTPSILRLFMEQRPAEVEAAMLDTPEELYELEQRHRALSHIREWYTQPDLTPLERALAPLYSPMHSVSSIGNQFSSKLVPCFLIDDPEEALDRFRAINPNTIDEEMVLLANNGQFFELYGDTRAHLASIGDEIKRDVESNLANIAAADRLQFAPRGNRSLEKMLEGGMTISINPAKLDVLETGCELAGEGILPVTEYVKNDTLLEVNGFMGSKISLAVHDFIDHIWAFNTLKSSGILDNYAGLFASVGNPEATDIFKREGEMVASIAFGVRFFQTMPSAFGPVMRTSHIEEHVEKLFVSGQLEERHMEAFRTLKGLRKGSVEWQSLGFTFSNYITELDEQRRKHGKIKQRDPRTLKIIGELDPMSPDYICMFIDAHHQILSSKNKHRDDLFRFHILLEEFLNSVASGHVPNDQALTIKLDQLRDIDFTKTTLPVQRLHWMRNNYGFTATRDAIV